MRIIFHIDFNSYFASVEQQANPRLRGKPVGVTGGDKQSLRLPDGSLRMTRTVLGAASVEAKRFGVKTGMQIWEAKKLYPQIIIVPGDSDKYLEVTKRFLGILSSYSPNLEVFSIDEVFLSLGVLPARDPTVHPRSTSLAAATRREPFSLSPLAVALDIKRRIKEEVGEWITCSIGISYNKLMAKLAGSLQKPDGLVVIPNQQAAIKVLDKVELDEVCGIGSQYKKRLNNMGVFDFKTLRKVPLETLLASFKSYGQILYNMARGIDESPVIPFYEKEEVKSIGHRHTIDHDTNDSVEIKQILLKLTELIARRLRAKKLIGKTVRCWYREAFHLRGEKMQLHLGGVYSHIVSHSTLRDEPSGSDSKSGNVFNGGGMQATIPYTNDGLEIFKAGWEIFNQIWPGGKIRMIGVSISNLKSQNPQNLSLLPEISRQEKIIQAIDSINDRYGEFTLQRGILLGTGDIRRKPNPYLADPKTHNLHDRVKNVY